VERDVLFDRGDMDMIAQPVEQLRAIGLRIDRLEIDPLDELAPFRPIGLGVEIDSLARFPATRQPPQRPEIGQGIGVDIGRLGEDVRGEGSHGGSFRPSRYQRCAIKGKSNLIRRHLPSCLRRRPGPGVFVW
jgi:hypothetical protein